MEILHRKIESDICLTEKNLDTAFSELGGNEGIIYGALWIVKIAEILKNSSNVYNIVGQFIDNNNLPEWYLVNKNGVFHSTGDMGIKINN